MKKNHIKILFLALMTALYLTNITLAQEDKKYEQNKPIEIIISTENNIEPLKLTLDSTLTLALKNNLNIAIKREKVNESKLQLDEVKSKRLFLFFKFTNVAALESSAELSLQAAEANLKATCNNTLEEASNKYYNLLQSLLAKQIAADFLKQGNLSLKNSQELYKSGNATNFEVKQTEVFVANLKQQLLESEIVYMVSSVDLAQYLNQEGIITKIVPEELPQNILDDNSNNPNNTDYLDNNEIKIKTLQLIPENFLLNDAIDYALNKRPELEELNCSIKSLEELKKATRVDEIKAKTIDSQINQLNNSLKLMQNTIKTTVTQALLKLVGAKNQIAVAQQKYLLSKSALKQATISKEEGIGTNKDVLDAQVSLATSQNDYIKAIISFNTAQITLLKEIGIINIDIITNNKPIEITKLPIKTDKQNPTALQQ